MKFRHITYLRYFFLYAVFTVLMSPSGSIAQSLHHHKSEMMHPLIENSLGNLVKVTFWVAYEAEYTEGQWNRQTLSYDDEQLIGGKPVLRTMRSPYLNDAVQIELSKNELKKFTALIDKYFEWNKIAIENNVTNNKSLGDVSVHLSLHLGDEWVDWDTSMNVSFFSQNTTRHQLLLRFQTLEYADGWVKYKHNPNYFDFEDVTLLKKLLQPELAQKIVEESIEKQKVTEDLFK